MFFSFGLSLAVIMEGYDTALLGNFYGIPGTISLLPPAIASHTNYTSLCPEVWSPCRD